MYGLLGRFLGMGVGCNRKDEGQVVLDASKVLPCDEVQILE